MLLLSRLHSFYKFHLEESIVLFLVRLLSFSKFHFVEGIVLFLVRLHSFSKFHLVESIVLFLVRLHSFSKFHFAESIVLFLVRLHQFICRHNDYIIQFLGITLDHYRNRGSHRKSNLVSPCQYFLFFQIEKYKRNSFIAWGENNSEAASSDWNTFKTPKKCALFFRFKMNQYSQAIGWLAHCLGPILELFSKIHNLRVHRNDRCFFIGAFP